ncbi:SMC family ATPase [Rhodococcus opacus]|uniref:AAA family ATPase n=2 Tax=Rhodococcus opacus TaxID=37919 RepID=UPI0022640695|nr:SMC family ATPase [Rhodococcus opacus]MDX5962837.1 SMC family ATPase [Rhodococcus opacus]
MTATTRKGTGIMLRLKSLEITNIRSVEHVTLNVDPDGTTALYGPSGVGKSGILDALPWCLWGDTGSAGSAAALRREGSTEPAQATATVLIGSDEIVALRRITRSDSGVESASAKLWINGVKQSNVTPASLTRIITDLTGLTAKTFRGAFYMAQGQLTDLMTGTPAKVQETFEELTGLDDLTKRIQGLREQCKEAAVRAEALPGDPAEVTRTADDAKEAGRESDRLQQESNRAAAAAASARTIWDTANQRAKELQSAERAARDSREAVVGAEALAADAAQTVNAARLRLHDLGEASEGDPEVQGAATRTACAALEQALSELTRRGTELKAAAGQESSARTAAEQARAAHDSVDPDALATAVTDGQAEVDAGRAAHQEVLRAAHVADAAVAQRDEAIATLSRAMDAAACPTCRQDVGDVAALIDEQNAILDQARKDAAAAHQKATTLDRALLDAETRLRKAHDALANVASLARVAEHAEEAASAATRHADQAAATLAELVAAHQNEPAPTGREQIHSAALAVHEQLTEQLSTARGVTAAWITLTDTIARAAAASGRVDQARAAVVDAPSPTDVAAAESREATTRVDLDTAQAGAADAAAQAQAARATAMQLDGIADDAATRWNLKREAAEQAEVTRIARDIGIALRRDLLAEYCATISAAATDILTRLGGEHVGFMIDETFVPQVVLPDGTTRATRQLSGGEKARAAVCAFIGFSRQLAGGGKPGMLFADEITASQDEAFRRDMLTMLRALEMPMIVVSHTADVLDIASRVIRLQRPPLGSTQLAA